MSKNTQRRQSAYDLGYNDYKTDYGFRWSRHPQLSIYRLGYRDAKLDRPKKKL